MGNRWGKCLVAGYYSVKYQRVDCPAHKTQCKLNWRFELRVQTEEVRVCKE